VNFADAKDGKEEKGADKKDEKKKEAPANKDEKGDKKGDADGSPKPFSWTKKVKYGFAADHLNKNLRNEADIVWIDDFEKVFGYDADKVPEENAGGGGKADAKEDGGDDKKPAAKDDKKGVKEVVDDVKKKVAGDDKDEKKEEKKADAKFAQLDAEDDILVNN